MPKGRPKVPIFAIGFGITLGILVLYFTQLVFLESIELKTFDWRARSDQVQKPPPDVVIVSIDDESIAKMGRWPWPRSLIARMIGFLSKSGATVVGVDILFSESEENQGLKEIQTLKDVFVSRILKPKGTKEKTKFLQHLKMVEAILDNDSKLISSVRENGNVVLPMYFKTDSAMPAPVESLPPYLEKNSRLELL